MKKLLSGMLLAAVFVSGHALAEEAKSPRSVSVYINPMVYQHETKLWHFYYIYWLNQGAAVEPIAVNTLKNSFADVSMCQGSNAADVLMSIEPHVSYNPNMRTFYGTVIINVHSGSGKPIGVYESTADYSGDLDFGVEMKVNKVLVGAMNAVMVKVKADSKFQALLANGVPDNETKVPCSMVSLLSN